MGQIKVWRDAQARLLDRKGIAELARSIRNEGLQNPPMVQRESKGTYLLMSGQRRLAALKRLGAKKIPVLLLTQKTKYGLEDAKAASVVENLHRNKMSTKDLTKACVFLAEQVGKAQAARSLGVSQQTIRNYLGFAAVPEGLRRMVPGGISRGDAVRIYRAVPSLQKAIKVAERASGMETRMKNEYLRALSRSPKASHARLLKAAKARMLQQKIKVELGKTAARKLGTHAARNDLTPDEMARKIVADWLKKR